MITNEPGPEQAQAIIDRAFELQQAKIAARSHHVNPAAYDGESLRTGEHAVYAPRNWLEVQLHENLGRWDVVSQHFLAGQPGPKAKDKALDAIELIESAIAKLGKRSGPREDAARAALTAQRDTLAAKLAHFESLGADLGGPLARELCARITASRAALAAAYHAKEHATRQTIEACLLEIEKCLAESRAIDRDIEAARAMLFVPEFPISEAFAEAEAQTTSLERQAGKAPSARAMYDTLHAAFNADPAIAKLFVIYETQPDHALVKLRAKALAEARG